MQFPRQKTFLKILKVDKVVTLTEQLLQAIDLMSPPYPLDADDAMGFHRDGMFTRNMEEFGSAIVELRNISYVKKFRKEQNTGFLTIPLNVSEELISLFNFLSDLKMEVK